MDEVRLRGGEVCCPVSDGCCMVPLDPGIDAHGNIYAYARSGERDLRPARQVAVIGGLAK
jgi:hypothetical protein